MLQPKRVKYEWSKDIDLRESQICGPFSDFLSLLVEQCLNSILSETDCLSQNDLLSFEPFRCKNIFIKRLSKCVAGDYVGLAYLTLVASLSFLSCISFAHPFRSSAS